MDDSANVNTTDVSDTQTTLPGSSSPNSPVITPVIPNRNFNEDTSNNAIILNNYVTDSDTPKANLVWSVSGNTNVIVSINPLDNNRVTFSAPANWNGVETITLRVQDPEGNWDSQAVVVTVTPVEDPTIWNVLSDQTIDEDSRVGTIVYPGVVLQVSDADSPTIVTITSTNTHFNVRIVGTNLVLNSLEHNWYGSELVTLTCNGVTASFTLNIKHLNDDCSTEYSLGGVEYTLCD
jgi:hypothetical protein